MTRGVTEDAILGILAGPTPPEEVRRRQGPGGKMLDYVDARYVMGKLDELGPTNWQSRHEMGPGGKVTCHIGILVERDELTGTAEWVWKSDGAGETDIEAEKGSFSDALKRAAVSWGVARDLYPTANQSGTGGSGPSRARSGARQAAPAVAPHAAGAPDLEDDPAWGAAFDVAQGRAPVAGEQCAEHPEATWLRSKFRCIHDHKPDHCQEPALYHYWSDGENPKLIHDWPPRPPRKQR